MHSKLTLAVSVVLLLMQGSGVYGAARRLFLNPPSPAVLIATTHTVTVHKSTFHHFLNGRGLTSFGSVHSGLRRREVGGAVKLLFSPDTQTIKLEPQLATVECCAATPERGVEQMNPATLMSEATEGNALIAPDCLMITVATFR